MPPLQHVNRRTFLRNLRRSGLFVAVGLQPTSDGNLELNPFEFFMRDPTLIYSAVGTVQDMRELVDLAAAGRTIHRVREEGRPGGLPLAEAYALCLEGVTPGGYRAIESLRLEKGYRAWATDLTAETTPFEAGLGFAVKLDKGDFIGWEALQRAEPRQRLVCIVLDDPRAVALGSEPVRHGDEIVGRVTSGGYGYAVGASIAYAYVPLELAEPGTAVAIDIFGDWVEGEVRADPLYDPKGERIRV